MGNPSPYPYLHRVVLQLDLSFIITSFMKRLTSPNLQCLLSTYHPIPVFLAGKVWVDGHELQGAVVLVLRHGGEQLGLEVHGGVGQSDGRTGVT